MTAPFWISRPAPLGPFAAAAETARRAPLALLQFSAGEPAFAVETLGLEEMQDDQAAWTELCARALEPNAFLEPGFALSAARHFPQKSRPHFVAVWRREPHAVQRKMMALIPLEPSGGLFGDGLAHVWMTRQAALGAPLADDVEAVPALAAFLDWLGENAAEAGVVFPKTPKNGPFHLALAAAARLGGRRLRLLDEYERAALRPGGDADDVWMRAASGKELRELRRRRRRLQEMGTVEFKMYRRRDEVRRATEQFLALEASGWKGGRGAFLSDPSLAAFARSATRLLARQGKLQIYGLNLSGAPIAMGLVLESQGRSFFWKMAYDETYRAQAPGVDLVYGVTRAQLGKSGVDLTDSCAIANHPMINRFWPDRIAICDIAVETRGDRRAAFDIACNLNVMRRGLRDLAKDVAVKALNRKTS